MWLFFVKRFLTPKMDVFNGSENNNMKNNFTKIEKIIKEDFKNLCKINIKNETGEYTIFIEKKENGELAYHLSKNKEDKLEDNLVQQSIIKNLIAEFEGLVPVKILEENCEDVSKYGLENEKNVAELTFDNGKICTLILGNEAPLSVGYYLKEKSQENKVYLITNPAAENFLFPVGSFLIKAKES